MNAENAADFVNEQSTALASKGTLLLTVSLDTPEQADEILRWMYSDKKPMKAVLMEVAWDKVAVSKQQAEALEAMRKAFAT